MDLGVVEQKQRELWDRCRHPTGKWQPTDWRTLAQSIPDRIAAIASSTPHQLAVYDHRTSLTFGELDSEANRIANGILAGCGPGQEVVALLVGVDVPALTAALAVFKSGKTLVALEPSYPKERSLQILADCGAQYIVADGQRLAQALDLAGPECQVAELEDLATAEPRAPGVPVPLDAMSVLVYTSGSSGRPKAVAQSHDSSLAQALRGFSQYHPSDADRVAFYGHLAWAGTIWNLFGPLCHGASSGVFDFRQLGTHRLATWMRQAKPTILIGRTLTRQIIEHHPEQRFASVRLVRMGGDTIYRRDVETCLRVFPNSQFGTGLGLSETGLVTHLLLDLSLIHI